MASSFIRSFRSELGYIADQVKRQYSALKHLRNRKLAILSVANLLDSMSTSIIVPLLPIYYEQISGGLLSLGLIFALPTVMRVLFSPLFGYISDRYARKPIIVIGTTIGAVGVGGIAFADTVLMLALLRAIDGIAAAMRSAPSTAYVGDIATDDVRGQFMGAYQSFGMLALALGPVAGGLLATIGDVSLPFITLGGVTLVAAVLLMALPRSHPTEEDAESISLGFSLETVREHGSMTILALATSGLLASVSTQALYPILAPLLRTTVDAGPGYVTLVWSAFGTGLALFVPVGGRLADVAGRKDGAILAKVIWAAVLFLLAFETIAYAPIVLFFFGGIASAFAGPALNAIRYETAPETGEGALMGFYSSVEGVGGIVGPLVGTLLASVVGLTTTVTVLAGIWVLDAIVFKVGVIPGQRAT